jgi:hypothetical protein
MQSAAIDRRPLPDEEVAPSGDDTRTELVKRMVDVLALPAGRMTANERAFAADILGTVLRGVDLPLRIEVSERLASVGVAPPNLLRQLALDVPAVARPLLTELTEVPESLLIEAARIGHEHRMAVCGRDGLTPAVAEALLESDEAEIITTLLSDPELAIGAARIESLLQRSRNDVSLRRVLLERPELQPAQAFAMFWWSEPQVRRRILARFALDRAEMQDTLQPLFAKVFTSDAPDPLVKRMLTLIDRRHRPRGRGGEMVTMDVVERTLTVARAAPNADLCEAVGLLAGVSTDTATKIMYDPGGEPFSVLSKSIGLSRAAFSAILEGAAEIAQKSGSDGPTFDAPRREGLMATFDMIARDYSRTVLRYWDWRPEAASPISGAPSARRSDGDEDEGYLGAV